MRHQHKARSVAALDIKEKIKHRCRVDTIQVTGRFVSEEEGRSVRDASGYGHPLALPAG